MTDCTLCDLPADDGVTGDEGTFCCRGCLEVYRTLGDVDPDTATSEPVETAEIPDDAETVYLSVDGMHCATCELYLESTASDCAGVYTADASYAAETVRVAYDSDQQDGNTIADALSGVGYAARQRGEESAHEVGIASRLLVGGIFGMMAMTWYALFLYPTYFGFDPVVSLGGFDGAYLYGQLAVVTAIILLYTGRPVLRGAYVSLRTGHPNVDLLVTIAATAAFLFSTGQILVGGDELYYDVTIVVIFAVTVGNYYESRIKQQTAGLLADLTELQVEEATRADGETVPVDKVEPGDRLLVSPGERVPVDGTVREGTAAVDEALVTGESVPETKRPGDAVRGGTVVTDAPLVVETDEEAASTLDRVVDLLWEIQASRPGAQRIADRLATVFVPVVLALAALVTGLLLLTGSSLQAALLTGLTVLIVSCPCALGLATPLAVASGLQSAANRGVVVTTPALFEDGGNVDTIVFDKTGTLTDGEMAVTGVVPGERGDEGALLARASAVEQYSEHPVADAVVAAAGERGVGPGSDADIEGFERHTRGVSGVVGGERVVVGHPDLLREQGQAIPSDLAARIEAIRARGDVPVVVGSGERASGVIAVGDRPRPAWEDVVATLATDHRIVVLTGDDGPAADRLREHDAIDTVFAGVPPDGKAETVRRLAATETVAMVGDGSNDAPALAAADLGIALDSGTKLATDAADAVVLDSDLDRLPAVFAVASGTRRRIRENLAWAFVYNGVAIPLALAGVLNPLFAALAMATSSLLVVANSAREPPYEAASEGETTAADEPPATGAHPAPAR
jgi:Cu2+-exporting ATPase